MGFKEKTAYTLLLVNIILNSTALFLILFIPLNALHYSASKIIFISIIIVIGLILLGFNESFQGILEKISIKNQREMFLHEKDYLLPIIKNVISKINIQENLNFNINDLKIKVYSEKNTLNAFIIGNRTLYVSEGFIYNSEITTKEKEAVLAHEFCHLLNKDSVFMYSIISANFVMKVLGFISTLYISGASKHNGKRTKKDANILDFIIPIVYFIFVKVLSNGIFTILLRIYSRKVEFRCDLFSAELGYRNDLISFFYKLKDIEDRYTISNSDNFLDMLYSTHPKIADRIQRLENYNKNFAYN